LQQQKKAPDRFTSWHEFRDMLPVIDRKTIQNNREALTSTARALDYWRTTGGSTAEPLQMPAWHSEQEVSTKDMWYARSWFGVTPSDRLFLIWGHSHLLGSGFQGWINSAKRRLKDAVLGYYRYSAYDLSERSLCQAAETLLAFQPTYIIAYAVALDRFARVNHCHRAAFHKLGLKVAIATAESFPRADSAQFIADVLGCPIAMEYGAVETGPIAHQRPDGQFSVFWRHYFLEGYASEHVSRSYEILVTSLYPRCFPLVRYKVGDLISAEPDAEHFRQEFGAVIGRCNDYVVLQDGCMVHSEAFAHALKETASLASFQVIQAANGHITLSYETVAPLKAGDIEAIKQRLVNIHPALGSVRIQQVHALAQTVAGKTRRVMRE
jgi:phenylacetate-CoA ligase